MNLLTENNTIVNSDQICEGDEVHFCVLDFSKPKTPDYLFHRAVAGLNTFNDSSVMMQIGEFNVTVPYSSTILISFEDTCDLISIEGIVSGNFNAFCINPIDGYMPFHLPVRVIDFISEGSWSSPVIKDTSLLVVPVGYPKTKEGNRAATPLCFMMGDNRSRVPKDIDLSLLW